MRVVLFIIGLLLATLPLGAEDSLRNPKDLVPPVTLTRADIYLDGGSLGGTLKDSRGQHLDFFFDLGHPNGTGDIYIGFISGDPLDSMKPSYKGWNANDLYLMIRGAILQQFVWSADKKKLLPKEPTSSSTDVSVPAARRFLYYVEDKLKSGSVPGK